MFTAISLFSGGGGLDTGFDLVGFDIRYHVEIDAICRAILREHWPYAIQQENVNNAGKHNLKTTDAILAGVTCQPASKAGKQLGANDERWLWPPTLRIVEEVQPKIVICENVPNLRLIDNGDRFREIIGGFARVGYSVEWFHLAASDVGAPQKRKRLFIVAYSECRGRGQNGINRMGAQVGSRGNTANHTPALAYSSVERRNESWSPDSAGCNFKSFMDRAVARISRELDGYRWVARPGQLQHEWEAPRLITRGDKYAVARLKALGNAVVPQVAQVVAWAAYDFLCYHYNR